MMQILSSLDGRLKAAEELIGEAVAGVRAASVQAEAIGTPLSPDMFPAEFVASIVDLAMPLRYRRPLSTVFMGLTDGELRALLAFVGGYCDPASTLTLPGASLSGAAVEALGDAKQQDRFFSRWVDDPNTRSFFGVTEPGHGTNAHLLSTTLSLDVLSVSGTKRWIGNLTNASTGVLFVRSAPGLLGIRAVLLDLPTVGADVVPLDMTGMRTAGLGELRLNDVTIGGNDVLGSHLPASRRGLWGMTQTFLRMRMQVASMALGAGWALLEEVSGASPSKLDPRSEELAVRGSALARMVWRCAGETENDGVDVRSSLCKAACVTWATDIAIYAGASSIGNRALVNKLVRDVVGLEFMEGVGAKQRQIIATDWLRQRGVRKDVRAG